ncbi:GGDEF domain-containing protein [Modestobacter roseus]|uniref:Diguanylate cyclase (GGDEF)-like protein n=1 Tax=Modestobacter roseus TaxID=1181884 RepID=A0A562ILZ6_9ACTN|nr:diguanylate cyclase [Modestobacter roseus]MQA32249.1 diguanylate cyclase [Modestobacter roseus]TWH71745.1 diguanylate cyclase (GGDEF)-like protein [Modestobacter roseus]
MRWSRRAPEVATARVAGPVIGLLYALGGLAVLAVVWLPGGPGHRESPLLTAIGPTAVLVGLGLVAWGRALPRWVLHLAVVLGTGLITAVVARAPDTADALALAGVYSFVAVAAFFLFAPSVALGYLLLAMTACVVVLAARGLPPGSVVAVALVTATIGLVVALLVRQASWASVDALTGLANRRGFDDALDEAVRVAVRSGEEFSVALADVDDFKTVNDEQGHAAGDELLCTVADSWGPLLPRGAVLARHGGDEFALLLPACSGPDALRFVERLRAASTRVPLSVGVAEHRAGEQASHVMRRADAALYRAKEAGRGRSELDR